MLFQFAPVIEAGIRSGVYEIVRNPVTGELLGIARDKATGRFVAHAVGMATKAAGLTIDPLVAPAQVLIGGIQMMQTHMGFQKTYRMLDAIQTSVGVLQATTAVIGVGTVAGVALSAVNLHQTLKLREDVKQLRLEVKDGFIDLKKALKDQGTEIIKRIDQVAQDVEYRHHRTILAQAYGRFIQALSCLKDALKLPDVNLRNAQIGTARGMLYEALADYNNPLLFQETSAIGQLRRKECAWAINQAITTTYQLQDADEVVSDRLSHLQHQICQDSLNIIDCCDEDELDFLFPEITRIHDHDLAVLNSWQNHVDWKRSLSPEDAKQLLSSDFSSSDNNTQETTTTLAAPPEQLLYENLKQKSHFLSLRDQIIFMMQPKLRKEAELYITEQAASNGYKALILANLQQSSNLAVANLYWYFKVRDESEERIEQAVVA
ncbi:MAG TPA: hypothetical protein V6D09_23820 [Leptolyngbyaceae cyanobacterium]